MRLLDLFCCQGGAGMGYHLAGFEVVGVDIAPQPRYPFQFVQADALVYLAQIIASGEIREYDAIHASPPCQEYSSLRHMKTREYPAILGAVRERLSATGLPWIMENVQRAPMHHGVLLCGTALGMRVRRHRLFDSSHLLYPPGLCHHTPDDVNVYGHGAWNYRPWGDSQKHWQRTNTKQCPLPIADAKAAFGASWMTQAGLAECIPPAYTQWLGQQLMTVLEVAA